MADAREQLLQSLMQDLQNFQLPERFSAEKKAQIEKGRKGQKDIDAGRATIADNERLYQDAVAKRQQLQDRISAVQTEIDTATKTAKQDDPLNQAAQYGKSIGVPLAGLAGGHALGAKFGKVFDTDPKERGATVKGLADQLRGIDKSAPASKAQVSAIVDTYDKATKGRPLVQFAGPAALGTMSIATQMGAKYADDPYLKEGLNLAATAERTGAGGMLLQQMIDTLRGNYEAKKATDQTDVASIESARRQMNEGGKFKAVQGALDPNAKPIAPPTPEAPALRTPSDRLISAAKAAGAKGKLTKATAAEWLTSANINDANRAAVATELGVGPGQRIAAAVKRLSTSRTASSLVAPLAAAGLAYDAASSDAEAAGAEPAEARTKGAVAGTGAAGVTAAGGYSLSKLLEKAPNLARTLGIGGTMTAPLMAMDIGPNTQEAANLERSRVAVNHPLLASAMGLTDEMGQQLPTRAPVKDDEFATARGLQIPEGIPAPNPDGSSPYSELVSAMAANSQRAAPPPPPPSLQQRRLIEAMMQGQR